MEIAKEKQAEGLIYFGAFTLDPRRHGLYRGAERVHLTSKPVETLIYLVENRGRVVEKRELLDTVWKDVFVTEDTLVHAIREIRRALEDDRENPRFVQTVPREGYRFIGDVSFESAAPRESVPAPASDRPKRVALPRIWIGLAGIAAVGLLFLLPPRASNHKAPESPPPQPEWTQLTSEPLGGAKPAFSPDGNILYNANGAIHIRTAVDDRHLQITDEINPSGDMPVFTADGSHVVFALPRSGTQGSRSLDLWIVPSSGGPPKRFIEEAGGAGFSPDGRRVAYTKYLADRKALWISPLDRLEEHIEVAPHGFGPRWSPDGKWLAYTTADPNEGEGCVWIVALSPAEGGQLALERPRQLTTQRQSMYGMSWTPDSRSLIIAARVAGPNHLYRISISDGTATPLTGGADAEICPSVSPDGKTLICWHGNPAHNLAIFDGLTSQRERLATQDEAHWWARLSPSGTRLASVMKRPDSGERLYITDLNTRKRIRLTDRPARYPCWVDDENVAYLEDSPGKTDVHVVNIATGVPSLLTQFPGRAGWLAIDPANKRMLAAALSLSNQKQRIVVRNLDSPGEDRIIAEVAACEQLRWSPDGARLAWSGPERSSGPISNGIWIGSLDGSSPKRLLSDGYGPVWSADGSVLYFSRIREYAGLWQLNLKSRKESRIRKWRQWARHDFDVVRNRLAIAYESGRGQVYSMPLN